jgi:hypothetical protein
MADVAAETGAAMMGGKKNKWLTHVKKTMRAHKGKSFKALLKMAKKTYRGGAGEEGYAAPSAAKTASPVGGRRKTRRGGRKH